VKRLQIHRGRFGAMPNGAEHRGSFAICAPAVSLAISGSARAETIFLDCGKGGKLNVDLTNSAVNDSMLAGSKLPATIDQTSIDWQVPMGAGSDGTTGVLHGHIDSVAATYTDWDAYHTTSGQDFERGHSTYSCTAGAALLTASTAVTADPINLGSVPT
jgi:hypothetical protein